MRQIGCMRTNCLGSPNCMTTGAAIQEKFLPCINVSCGNRFGCSKLVVLPFPEFICTLCNNLQTHVSMLGSTILCALPPIDSLGISFDPLLIGQTGNQLGFSGKHRYPKGV